jgi:hypothetical protein
VTGSRELVVLVALSIALSFTLGTGGVSSVTADRAIDIAVVDDQHGYLGFEQQTTATTNGTTTLNVTIQNQYPSETDLKTVAVSVDGTTVDVVEDGRFEPGHRRAQTFDSVGCGDSIVIDAVGGGVTMHLERTVSCD